MEELATALRSVLGHAVAALEHEEQQELHFSLNEYNSAWCDLCVALDLCNSGATLKVQELMREACPKLQQTYSSRFESIRAQLEARPSARRGSVSGGPQLGDVDVGQPARPAAFSASSSGNPGAVHAGDGSASGAAQPHAPAHMYGSAAQSENGLEGNSDGGHLGGLPPPSPVGGADGGGVEACALDGGGGRIGGGAYGSRGGSGGGAGGGGDAAQGGRGVAVARALPEMTEHMTEVFQQCHRPVAEGASLDDLAGLGSVKEEVRMALLLPMRMPHLFTGIRQPARNFLLHGPPGTGKTMLVERIAAEVGATLLVLTPGAVLSKWSGESEKQLRAVFEVARAMQPCIVFMDEVDSLAPTRGSGDDPVARRLLNELLVQMSYLASGAAGQPAAAAGGSTGAGAGVYVFAATNRIQDCDPALLRRFDRRVAVPLPDLAARTAFLEGVLLRPELAGHELGGGDVAELAERTQGYSGSDLSQLCREAAMQPMRELLRRMAESGLGMTAGGKAAGGHPGAAPRSPLNPRPLSRVDFDEALALIQPVGG